MSFVYAINDGGFMVLSDTKIGINENLDGLWKSEDSKRLIEQMGMIKSIIVSPHIVISYAGNNIGKAACLLNDVKSKNYDLETIIQIAFDIHKSVQNNDIEFIIAYYEDKNRNELISIKDREIVRDCRRAWIGSFVAYREFKRLEQDILKNRNEDLVVTVIDDSENMHEELIDNKMSYIYELDKAFTAVVESGIDSSVGGIVVRVGISMGKEQFEYMGGGNFTASNWPQKVEPNENITFYQGKELGSFCYNIYQSIREFCYYIYENNLGVIYTDEICYANGLDGLKFPKLYNMSKQEFDKVAKEYGAYSCIELRMD